MEQCYVCYDFCIWLWILNYYTDWLNFVNLNLWGVVKTSWLSVFWINYYLITITQSLCSYNFCNTAFTVCLHIIHAPYCIDFIFKNLNRTDYCNVVFCFKRGWIFNKQIGYILLNLFHQFFNYKLNLLWFSYYKMKKIHLISNWWIITYLTFVYFAWQCGLGLNLR